ncbi:hypothetical protein LTR40_012708 [Exophiala xenobiotica]|nr:hypothetical protein LTR40_012708 [Exophiala xenobiotica]
MDVVATSRSDPELDLEHPQDSGPTSRMPVQDSYQFFEAGLGVLPAVLAPLRLMLMVIMKSAVHELHAWIRVLVEIQGLIDLKFGWEVLIKCHHGIVHREGL